MTTHLICKFPKTNSFEPISIIQENNVNLNLPPPSSLVESCFIRYTKVSGVFNRLGFLGSIILKQAFANLSNICTISGDSGKDRENESQHVISNNVEF